ncbi:UDP-N-acetyl-D-mannosamine dehydrogenase [Streptomyces chiangmaiensis]|uniref:UDP-N-acetyl-D-mannosamine dehydrogenase n=1 Tax=Streptomyces chiangmaiensis TaxID=766497 RepID=A0ABU7FMD3_9ACTN|nr:UDP-N-acetyl-D-mannosamine dehydrogenase [Streptomyces chiangmaiensis]MED7825290.1 UDP-N-acetyl-D-mannosamine dehydrogenase [Streptomyces chiangmaiensis]
MFSSVCVAGLGYIGLPTAVALATNGIDVIGVDVNPATVELINSGRAPFVEPDLAVAVSGAVAMGRLRATGTPEPADAFIIAVPTPLQEDRTADLSYVRDAAVSVAAVLKAGDLVILESTSPPGTTVELSRWLGKHRPDLTFPHQSGDTPDVRVAHCPERVLPGRTMIEIATNDRVVGGVGEGCAERARDLYEVFTQGECLLTDATTAEMAKLSENAFRDVNIAFANEISMVCDHLGIDAGDVIALANRHPRVDILRPGPGVGGHCIAVDPWFIVGTAPRQSPLIRLAREVNDARPDYVLGEVVRTAERFKDPVVACLGLAFKANIDDLRESPALHIVTRLAEQQVGHLLVVEPHINELPDSLASTGTAALVDATTAVRDADVVVLLVDHDAFRAVKRTALRGKAVFDTRGFWH